jgi:hypothetical protein
MKLKFKKQDFQEKTIRRDIAHSNAFYISKAKSIEMELL